MNREILFRAKKVDGGEWVEGYVVQRYGAYRDHRTALDIIYELIKADMLKSEGE